jgi:undecaprenyl-diphosphatase
LESYTVVQAAILGAVQGLTEFLPVSSSAHLLLVPWFVGWNPPKEQQAFDVALHIGTLLAILIFFFRDWLRIIATYIGDVRMKRYAGSRTGGLLPKTLVASVPAAILGKIFERRIEEVFYHDPGHIWVFAVTMTVFGLGLVLAERFGKHEREEDTITYRDALLIGCFQALALIPGTSRSGITIIGGLILGLKRPAAARFSFLAATPITAGAVLFKLKDLSGAESYLPLLTGIAVSAIVGMIAIGGLLRFVQNKSYLIFAYYRWALAVVILAFFFARGGAEGVRSARQDTGQSQSTPALVAPSASPVRQSQSPTAPSDNTTTSTAALDTKTTSSAAGGP